MPRLTLVFAFVIILSCKSWYERDRNFISEKHSGKVLTTYPKDTSEIFVGPTNYTYLKYDKTIEFKIIGYEPAMEIAYGDIQGLPTGVFIGKTYDKNLPDTITILAIGEMRKFKFGQKIFANADRKHDSTHVALWQHVIEDKQPRPKYILGTKHKAFLATIENENK